MLAHWAYRRCGHDRPEQQCSDPCDAACAQLEAYEAHKRAAEAAYAKAKGIGVRVIDYDL